MVKVTHPGERPVLITDVGESPQEEYERRRRRYGAMMLGRVVCVIAAFVVGSLMHNIWLALACIVGAAVLPWAAVLIANDRLPRAERERMAAHRAGAVDAPALPAAGTATDDPDRPPRVIEG